MSSDRASWRRGVLPAAAALVLATVAVAGCRGAAEVPTLEELGVEERSVEVGACTPEDGLGSRAELRIDTLATGLTVPWDLTFLPDGRALFTERPGRIRVVSSEGAVAPEPWAALDVYAQEEVGLMGIDARIGAGGAVEVYVAATHGAVPSGPVARVVGGILRRIARGMDPERGHLASLRVLRIEERDGRGGTPEVVVEGIPAFMLHGGGALRIGPDGLLYLTNGDGTEPWTAHDLRSLRGKILRYDLDGSPAGFEPGSPVFARGIRHVQGMDWDARTGRMLAIDHGPSGMIQEGYRGNRDEVNEVREGDHLGWPVATGTTVGGSLVSALHAWTPAIAPAGLEIYEDGASAWAGSAFVTGLRGESLRRLELERATGGSWAVRCEETLLLQEFGRLRMIRQAPDGTLWVGTSNRDGRGVPRPGDDLLLRIHPPGAVTTS